MAATNTGMGQDVYPVDFSTVVGKIRGLVSDTDQVDFSDTGTAEYMFSDAYLDGMYQMATGEGSAKIYRAAASTLRALAISEGLIQKVIRTEDLQTDGAKLANAFLAGAKQLEEQAIVAEEDSEIMMVVDYQSLPPDRFPFALHGFPTGGFGKWL